MLWRRSGPTQTEPWALRVQDMARPNKALSHFHERGGRDPNGKASAVHYEMGTHIPPPDAVSPDSFSYSPSTTT